MVPITHVGVRRLGVCIRRKIPPQGPRQPAGGQARENSAWVIASRSAALSSRSAARAAFDVLDLAGARNGDNRPALRQHPGQHDLMCRDAEVGRNPREHRVARQLEVEPAAAGRTVRQKSDSSPGAVVHHALRNGLTEERIQPVLDRLDRDDRFGRPDLGNRDIGEPHPADLPLAGQLRERAHAVLEGYGGIGGMELVQVDPVYAESPEGPLTGLPEVRGPAVPLPAAVRAGEPAFGCHDDLLPAAPPGGQRRRNQPFVVAEVGFVETVDVRCVDERHPRVERGENDSNALGFRRAAFDGQMHPAVPHRRDSGGGGAEGSAKQARAGGSAAPSLRARPHRCP